MRAFETGACVRLDTHAHTLYNCNNKLSLLCLYLLMRALKYCLLRISFRYQSAASFLQCCYTAAAVVVLFRGQFLAIFGFDKFFLKWNFTRLHHPKKFVLLCKLQATARTLTCEDMSHNRRRYVTLYFFVLLFLALIFPSLICFVLIVFNCDYKSTPYSSFCVSICARLSCEACSMAVDYSKHDK